MTSSSSQDNSGLNNFKMEEGPFSGDSSSQTNFADLMMLTGESGIDEQWMSFMRDSGFLDAANSNARRSSDAGNVAMTAPVMNVF